MQFDSNRAWREATASLGANREVLLAVAGVFFLLPGIAAVFFLGDFQAEVMANFGNRAAIEKLMEGMTGQLAGFGLISFVLQSVGYLALLALLTDHARPTVGEAIGSGFRALPTVIGATLLFILGYIAATIVVAMLAGVLGAIGGAIAGVVVVLFLVGMVYAAVKLSLILPVIVIEDQRNPLAALQRSWRLTKGNSFRLFAFYLLLFIAYMVIAIVLSMVSIGLATLIAGQGKVAMLIGGVFSGLLGAAASVLFIAILAAIHRQLAGPSAGAIGATFD